MNTQTYVGIAIVLILVILLILYLTGVFSSGRRGFSSGEAADLSTKYPVLAHHEYDYPTGSTCSNPPTALDVVKIESTYTEFDWPENTAWVQGKYNLVEADGYAYWKHESENKMIYMEPKSTSEGFYYVSAPSTVPDYANPNSDEYGGGYSVVVIDKDPEHVYEISENEVDKKNGKFYKFKIKPC
jgi:hypothetical protein